MSASATPLANLSLRPARPTDVSVIVQFNRHIAQETEGHSLNLETLTAGVTRVLGDAALGRYFVAERNGEVIGQLLLTYEWSDWRNGHIWWIQSVYVTPNERGTGVFRQLYQHVLQAAQHETDVVGLRLYVENGNTAAQATYRRMGMVNSGYIVYEDILRNDIKQSAAAP